MTETFGADPAGPSTVADAIATARSLLGYSIEGAAERLGISASIIRDAESGEIEISTELQAAFEQGFGIELSKLVSTKAEHVPRTPIAYDATQGILRVGTLGMRFDAEQDDNDVLLRGFSAAVRRQRQLPPTAPIQLRAADLPVLATLLDLEDDELDARAQFWFGQTEQTAQSFTRMLRISRGPDLTLRESAA